MVMTACSETQVYKVSEYNTQNYKSVELDDILDDPESYHGKKIETEGIFTFEFENVGLYNSSRNSRGHDYENAVWLNFHSDLIISEEELKKIANQWITVKGTFDSNDKGHLSQFSGSISEVVYMK